MTAYGRIFPLLRAAAQPDWDAYTGHAFVAALGDGSLPREGYLAYLVQDYIFLQHFARAWALGAAKAGDLDEMRACSRTMAALVDHEIGHHVRICGEAGISAATLDGAVEHPANLAYTRYVLATGYTGDFLDLLAALLPCVLGYGEIGTRLQREAAAGTPYREWIDTYADPPFQQVCAEAGALLDRAVQKRLGEDPERSPRWDSLCGNFRTATRLEVGFWGLGQD